MAELVHRAVKLLVYALSVINSNNEELDDVFEILLKLLPEKRSDVFGIATNELSDSENEQDPEKRERGHRHRGFVCNVSPFRGLWNAVPRETSEVLPSSIPTSCRIYCSACSR